LDRALFVGRFQPFHHGHYEVAKRLLSQHDELIIVVGSAGSEITSDNPFTANERIEMIKSAYSPQQLTRITIVPVPDINDHSRWVDHVKTYIPAFDVVYSNNEIVTKLFSKAGIEVKPIEFIDRGSNEGKYIRHLMQMGNSEWKKHVPKGVAEYIEKIEGEKRLD
jgi:nicotinamide-nucleotide adenylyltransferase